MWTLCLVYISIKEKHVENTFILQNILYQDLKRTIDKAHNSRYVWYNYGLCGRKYSNTDTVESTRIEPFLAENRVILY